ncbi:MAG: hypothetical protein O2930_00645 [Acidobacteria bacterium]|nr:hypothetical protein [Acidobacteriota bacterium]
MTSRLDALRATLRTPGHWAVVVWCGVPLVIATLLATPSVTTPGDDLGLRRFQTPQLEAGMLLGQTFSMPGDGLYAIEVFPVAVGERVSGSVAFVLYDVTESRFVPVRGAVVTSDSLMQSPSYRFAFPPIGDSADHSYLLNIAPRQTEGVAFWATKGERYEGGSLRINNQDRWADLAFQTYAPAPSIGALFTTIRETHPARGHIVIGAFTAIWLLLGLLIRELAAMNNTPGADVTSA